MNTELHKRVFMAVLLAVLPGGVPVQAQVVLDEGTNLSVDVATDGRIVMDLLGALWVVPASGGAAHSLNTGALPASRPRWSPDNKHLVYQARENNREQLYLFDFERQAATRLSSGEFRDRHAAWHPQGKRIVYSSERGSTGIDLWELDVNTGRSWQLTSLPGDETDAAWSADGRDLVYVHKTDGNWSLQLQRLGQRAGTLTTSFRGLSAPAWRPDGSLISFVRRTHAGLKAEMAILSEPLLIRELLTENDLFDAAIAWHDRQRMVYTANGVIRSRDFDAWHARTLPFHARIQQPAAKMDRHIAKRELPTFDIPESRLIIRADRLFDGLGGDYRNSIDIVIDNGRIAAIEAQRERHDDSGIFIDMSGFTVLPGYIDSYAALPAGTEDTLGPALLALGITTMVCDNAQAEALNERWSGKSMPGPRVLRALDVEAVGEARTIPWLLTVSRSPFSAEVGDKVDRHAVVAAWTAAGVPLLAASWQLALATSADLMLGGESMPASPAGIRYKDSLLATGAGPVTLVSGLASLHTRGVRELFKLRPAEFLGHADERARRYSSRQRLPGGTTALVAGSKPNGLPPGIALHAELLALQSAGLDPEHVLRTVNGNAATALSAGSQMGRIATGAYADLVFVAGDPLQDVADAANVIAVVRNGRFFSAGGLLDTAERAKTPPNVE